MWFFYIFLFSVILLGSFKLGPFSIRVYMVLIMMGYLLLSRKKANYQISYKFMEVFLLYIIVTGLVLIAIGEFQDYDYINLCLAFYLPCFVTVAAINRFIDSKHELIQLMWFLVVLIFINCIVTQLQFNGFHLGKVIAMALTTSMDVEATILYDNEIDPSLLMGEGLPIGIFGFVFSNANYSAVFGILALFLYDYYNRNKYIQSFCLLVLGLCIYNCYMIQERTAFFGIIAASVFILFKNIESKNKRIVFICIFVIMLIVLFPLFWNADSLGRLVEFNLKEDTRNNIWNICYYFLSKNFLTGGPVAFSKLSEIAPHNYFLNALITSGIIGGSIAIYLYIISFIKAAKYTLKCKSNYTRIVASSVCIYALGSFFHNASIISGDTLFFILYAIMLKTYLINHDSENTMLYR